MHGSIRVLVALTLLAGIGVSPALAQRNKLDDELQRLAKTKSGSSTVGVIVKTRPDSVKAVADKLRRRGDEVRTSHPAAGAVTAEVRRDGLAALAADPAIESVSIDAPVSAFGAPKKAAVRQRTTRGRKPSAATPPPPPVNVLRATLGLADAKMTGLGIGVAIIDSGIQPVADFDLRITAFRDFTKDDSPNGQAVAAYDDYGHGTHIAGLIGSNGSLSSGEFRGVAPAVRLVGLKVLNEKGEGSTSDVIAALEFAIANRTALGIDVVNLSLGHPIYERAATDPLVQAVEKATRAGLIVVVAAGNFGENPETGEVGYAGIMSPGNAPSAITVGALKTKGTIDRQDDRVPSYSSRGPTWYDGMLKPDVLAPGDNIVSNVSQSAWLARRYPELVSTTRSGGAFLRLSGTSMSTAVTSGVVALVLESQRAGALKRVADATPNSSQWPADQWFSLYRTLPRVSANTVKALLQYSALRVNDGTADYDPLTQGAGGVNAEGATRLAFAVDATVPLGTQWLGSFGQPSTTIAEQALPWAQSIYWGGQEVLGPSIAMSELAWSAHVVWGTNIFWSTTEDLEHIVWGTSIDWSFLNDEHIVWGTSTDWSFLGDEHIVWGTGTPFAYSFLGDEHIVWGTNLYWDEHIVWGTSLIGLFYDEHIVWGSGATTAQSTAWGNLLDLEHIVWGTGGVFAAGVK